MANVIYPVRWLEKTPLERDIYGDVPNVPRADDEQIFGIPIPTRYPTKPRALSPGARVGGDSIRARRRPRLFRGSIILALEILACAAALYVAAFIISAVGP